MCFQGMSKCSHHSIEHHYRQGVTLVHSNLERSGLSRPGGTGNGGTEVSIEVGDDSAEA